MSINTESLNDTLNIDIDFYQNIHPTDQYFNTFHHLNLWLPIHFQLSNLHLFLDRPLGSPII